MNRSTGQTSSQILSALWEVDRTMKHKKRLKNVKSTINNKPPKVYSHISMRLKKEVQAEERLAKIDRENHLLLGRMEDIRERRKGMDNKVTKSMPSSLRGKVREAKNKRIQQDNEIFVKRLQEAKGQYRKSEWDAHSKKHTAHLSNLSNDKTRSICKRIRSEKKLEDPTVRRNVFQKNGLINQPSPKKKKKASPKKKPKQIVDKSNDKNATKKEEKQKDKKDKEKTSTEVKKAQDTKKKKKSEPEADKKEPVVVPVAEEEKEVPAEEEAPATTTTAEAETEPTPPSDDSAAAQEDGAEADAGPDQEKEAAATE